MYRYRIKIPTFLLGCLLLVAVVDVVSATRMRTRINHFVLPPGSLSSAVAFDAKLATITDPGELRSLASKQHQNTLAADNVISLMPGFLSALNRSLLVQSWGVLGLVVLYYLLEYRMPPR